MLQSHTLISVQQLKNLLHEMAGMCPEIGIRFRMLGELWFQHFANILFVTEHGLVLNDLSTHSMLTIYNLDNVVQFEIDQRFKNLEPYFHYEVVLSQNE